MKTLTHTQFVNLLRSKGGALPVGIRAVTDAKLRKTGNPFIGVVKHVSAVGFVGANYGASVRREGVGRQAAWDADSFVAAPRPWGAWVEGLECKVAVHQGRYYLRTQSTPGQRKRQPAKVTAYRDANGVTLSHAQIAPFMPAKSTSAKQSAVGIEAHLQVDVREYAFDSIKIVRVMGCTYRLIADSK